MGVLIYYVGVLLYTRVTCVGLYLLRSCVGIKIIPASPGGGRGTLAGVSVDVSSHLCSIIFEFSSCRYNRVTELLTKCLDGCGG